MLDRLAAAPPVLLARGRALGGGGDAWIVGGAVRDAALGREVTDLDLAVAGDPGRRRRGRSRRAATGTPSSSRPSSGPGEPWAAIDGSWQVDVTALRGETIEADLAARDFTVGAVAVPLAGGEPLDPHGGLADLERGVLRAVGERSFAADPLRLLRAARLACELELEIDPQTLELARSEAARATEPAGERQLAELRNSSAAPTRCAASPCSTSWA